MDLDASRLLSMIGTKFWLAIIAILLAGIGVQAFQMQVLRAQVATAQKAVSDCKAARAKDNADAAVAGLRYSESARERERFNSRRVAQIGEDHARQVAALDGRLRNALERLRNPPAGTPGADRDAQAGADPAAAPGFDGAAFADIPRISLDGARQAELARLGAEADAAVIQLTQLQTYVRDVCKNPLSPSDAPEQTPLEAPQSE
jgi:hypothetical protein